MQWGWNPDTIEAITTALAAIAAVVAGFFAWRAYQAESDARDLARLAHDVAESAFKADRDREVRELEEKQRAQAEMVSAWAVIGDGDEPSVEICIQNLSPTPVFAVCLGMVVRKGVALYARRVRVLPPSGREPRQESVKDAAADAWRTSHGARTWRTVPLVEFTFHDAAGRWWFRDEHGVLTEISERESWRYGAKAA